MMEFKNKNGVVECWDYCFYKRKDICFGIIILAEDGGYVFHPIDKVVLTTRMLSDICEYQKNLNRKHNNGVTR